MEIEYLSDINSNLCKHKKSWYFNREEKKKGEERVREFKRLKEDENIVSTLSG